MSEGSPPRRPAIWELAAVGSAAFAWQLPYFDRWMSLMDEGHILAFANMLSKGGELYRDASMLPLPGAFYLLELAFELFGPSILVARWIVVIEFTALTVVAFALLRRLVPVGAAWAGVAALLAYRIWAFPHWHMYSYSTTALTAIACALLAFVRFLDTRNRWLLALAGLATGLGALCKQDYGAAGWVAMNGVLVAAALTSRKRELGTPTLLAWYNLPAAAVGAVMAVHFLRQGLFLEMFRQTFLNHLIGISSFGYTSYPPLFPLFEQEPLFRGAYELVYGPSIVLTLYWGQMDTLLVRDTLLWDWGIKLVYYGPYLVAAAAALRMAWLRSALRDPERRPRYLVELTLSVYAIVGLAALNRPIDWVHVVVLFWPFIALLVVWAHAFTVRFRRTGTAALVVCALPALVVGGTTAAMGWQLRDKFPVPYPSERAGVYVEANEAQLVAEVVDYIQANSEPGEAFAVLPYFPLISFLADRPAPHRAAWVLWPQEDVPNRQQEIIEALGSGPTQHALYHFTQNVPFPRMNEFAPDLFDYLVDTYEIDRIFSDPGWGYQIAGLRRSEPPAGREILASDLSNGTLRLEAPGRAPREITGPERDRFAAIQRWPFREVLSLRPLAGGRRTALSVPVEVPEGGRLQTAIAVHPTRWTAYPHSSVTFSVRAVVDGERERLYTRTLDPHRDHLDRNWFDVDVALDAYGGRSIELEFVTETEHRSGELFEMAGWGLPRLVDSDS